MTCDCNRDSETWLWTYVYVYVLQRNIDLRVDDDNAEQVFGKFIRNCVEEEADSEGESNSTTPLSSEAIAAARRVVEYVENWYTNGRINSRRDN